MQPSTLCRNCQAPLLAGQRFFCDDRCRREYQQRNGQPAPVRVGRRCWYCQRELPGRRRKWCGESCRNRYRREREKLAQMSHSYSGTLENNFTQNRLHLRPGLTGFHGDYPGRVRRGELAIRIRCTQITPALGNYQPELHLKSPEFRQKYKEALERLMNSVVFGYVVEVEIT